MAAPIFNVSARKVGGIRFLKLGRINISLSVSKPAHAVKVTARAMVERTGEGFLPVVFLCRDGKPHSRHAAPVTLATAGDAMFHARAAVAACGLTLAR